MNNDILQKKNSSPLKKDYTLREISNWVDTDNSTVKIPDLQRGLVWKPRQMELLWDSMLRGFPIGSFILSDAADDTFFLMDGQQRFNAIAAGFKATGRNDVLLWLDISPTEHKGSTREFWVKSTTIAHPWGFSNDDQCTPLSNYSRRKALELFGKKGQTIYKDPIPLSETWPYMAVKPVPLHFFLNASLDSPEVFATEIANKCKEHPEMPYANLSEEDLKRIMKDYYPSFKTLDEYRVQCVILSRDVLNRESNKHTESTESTPLEILFNRLNTEGTRISPDDLNYSAIKAYWGGIKERNEEIAKQYLQPSKLVMLAFRFALTKMNDSDESNSLCNPLTIKQIREYASNAKVKALIEKVYTGSNNLGVILKKIDEWLGIDNNSPDSMPAYIRTSIARESPEVFLLLMYLAYEELEGRKAISDDEVRGIALLIHWLGTDENNAARTIFKYIRNGGDSTLLKRGLSECLSRGFILPVFSPDEIRSFFTISSDSDWTPWVGRDYAPWHDFYSRISNWENHEAQEMLLYAQRSFIHKYFSLYDPGREDMWESHNRPWDYDHIIPKNWIKEKGKRHQDYTDYCYEWVNRIGNIAAIPFEENRYKGDRDAYDIYLADGNKEKLLFDDAFLKVKEQHANLVQHREESVYFAVTVFARTIQIYSRCYDLFKPLLVDMVLTESQSRRRQMMKSLASRLDNAETVFVATGGSLEYDSPLSRNEDWTRQWISVGVRRQDKYFVCFTWGYDDKGEDSYEIGIRRLPGKEKDKDMSDLPVIDSSYSKWRDNPWWYLEKGIELNDDNIYYELRSLLKSFESNA